MQNAEQSTQPNTGAGSLTAFALGCIMQSDEMWALRMKEKKKQECPWMTDEELNDYMMDIYADRQQDRLRDPDHYGY